MLKRKDWAKHSSCSEHWMEPWLVLISCTCICLQLLVNTAALTKLKTGEEATAFQVRKETQGGSTQFPPKPVMIRRRINPGSPVSTNPVEAIGCRWRSLSRLSGVHAWRRNVIDHQGEPLWICRSCHGSRGSWHSPAGPPITGFLAWWLSQGAARLLQASHEQRKKADCLVWNYRTCDF